MPRFLGFLRSSMFRWFIFQFGSGERSTPLRWCLAGDLDPEMSKVFFFCVLVMHCLMAVLLRQRYQLERLRYETHEAQLAAEDYAAQAAAFPAVKESV